MEKEILVFFLGALAVPGFTWWLVKKTMNGVTKELRDIKDRQTELREKLPIDYVRVVSYEKDIQEIKELIKEKRDLIQKIFEKLDTKTDKT